MLNAPIFRHHGHGLRLGYQYILQFDPELGDISALTVSGSKLTGQGSGIKIVACDRNRRHEIFLSSNTNHELYGYFTLAFDEEETSPISVSADSDEIIHHIMSAARSIDSVTVDFVLNTSWSEQAKVAFSVVAKFVMKKLFGKRVNVYVPDFKRAVDHFCIHAGGRAVIDGIEKNMKLEKFHTEPSRMVLLNYGNTSSSSIWYEMEYIMNEQKTNPLRKGDRIMQVAFGSGFKCTSGVWLKL